MSLNVHLPIRRQGGVVMSSTTQQQISAEYVDDTSYTVESKKIDSREPRKTSSHIQLFLVTRD